MLLNCPNSDDFLELVSVPEELPLLQKRAMKSHLFFCSSCKEKFQSVQVAWQQFLKPNPEITSSLLKVYSRLQSDETLILKGWKLGSVKQKKSLTGYLLNEGWLFRGGLVASLFIVAGILAFSSLMKNSKPTALPTPLTPMAQIRFQDKNKVQIHFLQPELLHTIEFETNRGQQ